MKAPDKIYIRPQTNPNMLGGLWSGKQTKETTVPYIRKDAIRNFIFKMIDALNDRHLLDDAIHCALNGIIEELDSL